MQLLPFRALFVASIVVALSLVNQSTSSAQTKLDVYGGMWVPFLPNYEAISVVGTGGTPVIERNIFKEAQSDVGLQVGVRGANDLNWAGKAIVFDVNFAGADSIGSSQTFADPNGTSSIWMSNFAGNNRLASPNNTSATFSLNSDVIHYSEFLGLRDRFHRGRDKLDVGFGFSHMGFQQNFKLVGEPLNGGLRGQYLEDLDTTYLGAEFRATQHKYFGNLPVHFDLGIGVYDMNADYEGTSQFFDNTGAVFDQARVGDDIRSTAASLTLGTRVDGSFRSMIVRSGINFKYVSHMASIHHPQANVLLSNPNALGTKAGWFLGLNIEFLFCCHSRSCGS